uniref:SKAP protein n=1 Tax=Cyanoderma ruficeps TaxID=181631 RepID=A0A8C3R7I3_9PASS
AGHGGTPGGCGWRRSNERCSGAPALGSSSSAWLRGELQMAFPSKRACVSKTSEPESSRVPRLNFSSNVTVDSVCKAANQGCATPFFCPLNRHQLEAELKNKNQLVETLKQQLAKKEIRELKKENERLVHEVEKLKKIQGTCMTILESRNINPGKEFSLCLHPGTPSPECFFSSTLTKKVTEELTLFCHTVAKEDEMLETAMAKWKSVQEENQRALEKQSDFQVQIKECTAMLEALEELLAM